jgi:hypothetical protein
MSDDTTTTTDTETVTEEPVETETVTDWEAKYKEMQKHSREWEKRAKAAEPSAKKLAEIEEASKTELEKVQAQLAEFQKNAAEKELAALRAQVALEKGLTPSQAKRLVGASREDLEADADDLLADLKASKPATAPSSDGQGKQGEPVGQTKQITSLDELNKLTPAEQLKAYEEGRLADLGGKK